MNHEIDFYDPDFLDKLKDLHIVTRKLFQGRFKGKRRSLKRGLSLEFADYRKYSPGDDFRFVDWNILARLKKIMVRSFWDESNINIILFIDVSKSMCFGDLSKSIYARKVAACLSSVALENHDSVGICLFSDGIARAISPVHGSNNLLKIFAILNSIKTDGKTNIHLSISQYIKTIKDKGIAVVISDLFDSDGYKKSFAELINKGFEVNVIHLKSGNVDYDKISHNVCLEDSETGEYLHADLDSDQVIDEEKKYCNEIRMYCLSNQIAYFPVETSYPFDKFVLDYFKYHITAG